MLAWTFPWGRPHSHPEVAHLLEEGTPIHPHPSPRSELRPQPHLPAWALGFSCDVTLLLESLVGKGGVGALVCSEFFMSGQVACLTS